ncbi:MAG: methyl-accepting chemotaxis protein [Bdellovibrionia bacterium]
MKLSIELKLLSLFSIATICSVGGLFFAYDGTKEMVESMTWVTHTYEVNSTFADIRAHLKDAERSQRNFILTGDLNHLDPFETSLRSANTYLAKVKALTSDNANQQERIATLSAAIEQKAATLLDPISIFKKKGEAEGRKAVASAIRSPIMNKAFDLIQQGIEEEKGLLIKREEANQATAAHTKNILILVSLIGFLVAIMQAVVIRRTIINPIAKVLKAAIEVAAGNLKQEPLPTNFDDEIADLSRAFNQMVGSIRLLATQNISISKNLASATAEVLASVQEQAAATKQQAASVQETTATMEEIGQSGNQISERAKKVTANAESSSISRTAGLSAVQGTNRTMLGVQEQIETVAETIVNLSERNQAIGEIISTVNDIAERSDLLALNAAIEAAAAGEQGRSFSIVANEIKSLAEQAKESTIEVRSILSEIQKGINSSVLMTEEAVKRAENGKQQSGLAEQTINQLTQTTQESIEAFQQILAATYQQQIGFGQITQALKAIQIGAQQTAASTTQLERAAYSMNNLGQQLQTSAERYLI